MPDYIQLYKSKIAWFGLILLVMAFLYGIRDVLLPFILGLLIGYFLDPVVRKLEIKGLSRTWATTIILGGFFIVALIGLALIAPILIEQLSDFIEKLPSYKQYFAHQILPKIQNTLSQVNQTLSSDQPSTEPANAMPGTVKTVNYLLDQLAKSGAWLFNIIALLTVTPIVAFYMLRDWPSFTHHASQFIPEQYESDVKILAQRVDDVLSGFIRGQINVCFLLGLMYAIGLSVLGVKYGFVAGLFAGLLTFFPYVGTILGAIMGLTMAFIQFGNDWSILIKVGLVFMLGQFIEGNFLTPNLVGNKVKLHPAWLIFGMMAGGSLLGTVGILLAVPITAVLGIFIRYAIEKHDEGSKPNIITSTDGTINPGENKSII